MYAKLTQMKYYCLLLVQNDIHFYSLGRLANKHIGNMFSHMEDEQLDYRHHGLINTEEGNTDIDYH